jgi:hypothetical protein
VSLNVAAKLLESELNLVFEPLEKGGVSGCLSPNNQATKERYATARESTVIELVRSR